MELKRVFISNITHRCFNNSIVIDTKNKFTGLPTIDSSGNTIFIIDVHCTFKGAEKMQQQGGVIIYRHLLKQFEKCQDKLKVVFYSPIPKDDLVKLKPENYVLKLLPFVECNYSEGLFERSLNQIILADSFPQFNNAAENMLSGWAMFNEKKIREGKEEAAKIDLKSYKFLIVDDEWQQWENTYSTIFNSGFYFFLKNEVDVKNVFKNYSEQDFSKLCLNYFNDVDLVISDLYLFEAHELEAWKDKGYITKVSGYKFLKRLRKKYNTLPVVFHSSSNKVMNLLGLLHAGIDGYVVKNTSELASSTDRCNNFSFFYIIINSCVAEYGPVWINAIAKDFADLKTTDNYWWINSLEGEEHLEEIKLLLNGAFVLLKDILFSVYNGFHLESIDEGDVYSIKISNILANYGKAIESIFGVELKNCKSFWLRFIHKLKAEANHGEHFLLVKLKDVIIATKLIHLVFREEKLGLKTQKGQFRFPLANYVASIRQFEKGEDGRYFYQHIALPYIEAIKQLDFLNEDSLKNMIVEVAKIHINEFACKWKKWTKEQRDYFLEKTCMCYLNGDSEGDDLCTENLLTKRYIEIKN